MTESLLSNSRSDRFMFIMTPTRGENLWPPSQKQNDDSTFRNTRTVDNMLLKPMPSEPYKWVGYWDSKGAKSVTSRVNIYCLHLIKPYIIY